MSALEIAESDPELLRAYRRWNRKYHVSRLPEKIVLWWEAGDHHAEMGDGETDSGHRHGLSERDEYYIVLDPALRYDIRLWGLALHHEMAHLACWPYEKHGARFQDEMLRLATLGAFKNLW